MHFYEKYTSTTDKDKAENKDKIVITDDSYAICDVLCELTASLKSLDQATRLNR